MQEGIHRWRRTDSQPARLLAFAVLASGILVAGCGGSSHTATASASSPASGGSTGSSAVRPDPLAFAKCMRANGVPGFPDPTPAGRFRSSSGSGVGRSSPAFKAAAAECQKFMPGMFGTAGPTYGSEQALVQLQAVAVCMRAHGVPGFPDPKRAPRTTTPGPTGTGYTVTLYQGVLLEFPATINRLSPAFRQAAAACGGSFLARR